MTKTLENTAKSHKRLCGKTSVSDPGKNLQNRIQECGMILKDETLNELVESWRKTGRNMEESPGENQTKVY